MSDINTAASTTFGAHLKSLLAPLKFDEVREYVYLDYGFDAEQGLRYHSFSEAKSIFEFLSSHVPSTQLSQQDGESLIHQSLESAGVFQFFSEGDSVGGDKIISADQILRSRGGLAVKVEVSEINAELVIYLTRHPEMMRNMEPRKFELLVAELFKDKGYEVEVTPPSRDGGFDIRIFHKVALGRVMTLVECKRYGQNNKVGVEIVRGLYGVMSMEDSSHPLATRGIVATTSFFTKGAKSVQQKVRHRLELADFENLKLWLMGYRKH